MSRDSYVSYFGINSRQDLAELATSALDKRAKSYDPWLMVRDLEQPFGECALDLRSENYACDVLHSHLSPFPGKIKKKNLCDFASL